MTVLGEWTTVLQGYLWPQSKSDCPKWVQIRDIFRSDFNTFWAPRSDLKKKTSKFVPYGANLTDFGAKPTTIPETLPSVAQIQF